MARKRLNTKFLTMAGIGLAVVLVLGVVGFLYGGGAYRRVKWMVRGTPAQHVEKAKSLYTAGKYEEAAEEYKRAMQLKGAPDSEMYTELGDCYSHLTLKDTQNLRTAKACWDQAVAIDQKYLPALKRLLTLLEDDAERNGRSPGAVNQWEAVEASAAKVLEADPNDIAAKISLHRSLIERSALGVEIQPARIDEAIVGLLAASEQGGKFNADAVFYVMRARMSRAADRMKLNDRAGANEILNDVMKMVDAALAAHPEDATMHYRSALVLRSLGYTEVRSDQPGKYADRVKTEFEKAVALAKPTDEHYLEMKLSWAGILDSSGDAAAAEKVYRSLLAEMPEELSGRIALAELLGRTPSRRQEAIDLLEHAPPADYTKMSGIKAFVAKNQEAVALYTLLNAKLDLFNTIKGQPADQAVLADAEEVYSRFSSITGVADSAMGLQARGRIELSKGQNLQAKQTLERALSLLPAVPSSINEADQRYRLMFMLAGVCLQTNQTGDAQKLLTELVRVNPKFTPPRLLLAQILVSQQKMEEARPQVAELARLMPDSPVVTRLQIFTLDKQKEKAAMAELYDKLPQSNREELIEKAQMAIYCERKDEAIKLFEMARTSMPTDLNVIVALARLYSDTGDKARSTALMEDAVAKNPDRADLKLVQAQLAGSDEQVVLRREMIDQMSDPLAKELAFHDLAVHDGNTEEAIQHLAKAIQLKPEDGRVLDLQFRYAVAAKDWVKSAQVLEILSRQNRDQAGGLLYRVRYLLARGELKDAMEQAQQLTQKMPEFAQSWVVMGQVQRAQNKPADALSSFELALQKQPTNPDALKGAIEASYSLNDNSKARLYIAQARKVAPNNVQFKEVELQHELAYGDPQKVIAPREENLKQAIDRKDPSEPQAWLALGTTYLAVARTKDPVKDAAAIRQLVEKARDTLKQAQTKFPDEATFVRYYLETAVQLKDLASGEKAVAELAARPAWQGKPEPVLLLSSLYARMNKPAEQEKTLRDFLANSPQSIPVQIQLASLLSKQNKLDDALKILSPNADEPAIRRQRIELQLAGNRLADAEKEINSAMAALPTPSPFLQIRQANVYMQSGRASQALTVLENVLAQAPNNAEARFYRAQIYVAAHKNIQQAIQDLQAVRDLPGNELQARTVLAEAYRYAGDDEAAMRELEEAVKAFPTEKAPRLRLLSLYTHANPPRWNPAERLIRESRGQSNLANDLDLLQAEARTWLDRKDTTKANDVLAVASKAAPNDMNVFRLVCEVMYQAKQYQPLIARTEPLVKAKTAPWWVYQYRGRAKKAATQDRAGALEELSAGMEVASNAKDDEAASIIVQTIVDEIGAQQAKARIFDRASKGDNRWRLMMAYVMQVDNDIPNAVGEIEKVISDPNVTPDDLDAARRMGGALYLRLSPPETAKAVDVYKKLLERNPNDPIALNNLACTMILPNSGFTPKDAIKYSEQAYNQFQQRNEVNPYIYDTQGYMLVLIGRLEEGISILQKAIDKEAIPEACYHLGEAFLALPSPRQADATEVLQQAATLLEAAAKDNKPIDADLKSKIDKALDRARQVAVAKPQ